MSLPHALLGLINYKPATGYDLKTTFENSIHFFWNAALPHIYRTLKQMEQLGWINATIEHQEGKPSRRVYQLNEAGRQELLRWLAEPPELPEPRLPLLVKVFFGSQMHPNRLREHLKRWREYYLDMLRKYEKEVQPIVKQHSAKAGESSDSDYWALTLDFGQRHARMVVEWCDQALKDLEASRGQRKKSETE
jgi:DNA-binding PadR family transcriptional regulator